MNSETEVDHTITNMANCLMLLSHGGILSEDGHQHRRRVFECKTCSQQFGSFQALGGHRASHKKLRFAGAGPGPGGEVVDEEDHGGKPKTHECSVCGLEFTIGQALGGHMRRHRLSRGANNNNLNDGGSSLENSKAYDDDDGDDDDDSKNNKSNKRKRVMFLDLNLTPFENDLVFLKIGKPTPFEISLGV